MNSDLNHITESIIGCTCTVGNTLGHKFLEKAYKHAFSLSLWPKTIHTRPEKLREDHQAC